MQQFILFRIKDHDSTVDITDDDMDDDLIQVLEDIRLTKQREDEDTLPEILVRLIEITELNERYQYVNTSSNCVLL